MKENRNVWQDYRRLLGYLKPYLGAFMFASFCMVLVSASSGGAAMLIQPLLDDIFIKQDREMLEIIPPLIIGVYFLRGIGRYAASTTMLKLGQQTIRDVRNHLYRHIQTLSLSFFHRHTTGRLVSRMVNDIQLVQDAISIVVYDIFREGFTIIALFSVLLYRDAKLTMFTIVVIPFSAYLIAGLGKRLRSKVRKMQEKLADLTSLMHETFSGYRIVQAFGMQKYEIERFRKINEKYFQAMLKTIRITEVSSPLMEFVGVFGIAAVIWYGGLQVINGTTTVGAFFSFLTALFMLFPSVSRLSRVYNKMQQAISAAGRIFEIIDIPPEIMDKPSAVKIGALKKEVKIENVSFAYEKKKVLQNISVTVKAGGILAIVGTSGAGKSTLVDLIARFYDPVKGRILFDDLDISTATLESVRGQIGVVMQDVFLFNDTVRNNIAYGRNETELEIVISSAKAAYAHDFIMQLPGGYETNIGERGVKLSGGQKQRLSIARAIFKNPAILILDEATSALDTESEREVQKALGNLMKSRTTFVIAHRLSTILHADRIIVLGKGRIVEEGTHDELIQLNGIYKRLYQLQFLA